MDFDTMEAGAEMDALVEALVMERSGFRAIETANGLKVRRTLVADAVNGPRPYSTHIAAAFEVVRHLRDDGMRFASMNYCTEVAGEWRVDIYPYVSERRDNSYAYADTLPLAICRAALKASTPTEQ